jgi:predicted alpha/beta hydrolase
MRPEPASPDLHLLESAFEKPPSPRLRCEDGTLLAARWYEPATPARAVAVISPATGVPQRYYRYFAQWLAGRGYAVLTYDYRGIGESRSHPLRQDPSRMFDWARQDMSTALAEANRRRGKTSPRLPLLLIGHSFGGNAVGLARGIDSVDALLTVCAQSGDWRNWPLRTRWITFTYFHAVLPVISHLLGCAPGWALGGDQGLPKKVALEWSRWCRRRGYLFNDPALAAEVQGFGSYRGTAHVWSVSDDHLFGPEAAVDALAAQFRSARVSRQTLDPIAVGRHALGHFGVFKRSAGPAVWERLLDPIEADTPALQAARQ